MLTENSSLLITTCHGWKSSTQQGKVRQLHHISIVLFTWMSHRGVCDLAWSMSPVSTTVIHSSTYGFDFHAFFISEGEGFILVYSITSRTSFDRIQKFHQSMRKVKKGDPVFMLVGNKCDKTLDREVLKEESAILACQLGCGFLEASAKTTQNVELLFMNLIRSLRQTTFTTTSTKDEKRKRQSKCVVM